MRNFIIRLSLARLWLHFMLYNLIPILYGDFFFFWVSGLGVWKSKWRLVFLMKMVVYKSFRFTQTRWKKVHFLVQMWTCKNLVYLLLIALLLCPLTWCLTFGFHFMKSVTQIWKVYFTLYILASLFLPLGFRIVYFDGYFIC